VLRTATANAPCLVQAAITVFAGVGSMNEQTNLPGACGGLDPVEAIDEVPGTRFHSKAIERGLAQRRLRALAEVCWHLHIVRFEGALKCGFQLTLGIRLIELRARDTDPRAPTGRAGAHVGRDFAVRREGEPDQLLFRRSSP
jgi:hypothetical protein